MRQKKAGNPAFFCYMAAPRMPPTPAFDIARFAAIFAAIGLAIGAIGGILAAVVSGIFSHHQHPVWCLPDRLAASAGRRARSQVDLYAESKPVWPELMLIAPGWAWHAGYISR
jgi:hypothetical protein